MVGFVDIGCSNHDSDISEYPTDSIQVLGLKMLKGLKLLKSLFQDQATP